MCGILAWWKPASDNSHSRFQNALALQNHRGPDHTGFKPFPEVLLGHNRLSILDLNERSHQPMSDAEGRFWITYNGEIYNYVELKAELEKDGAVFKTTSDTEVILEAFRRWGVESFNRFNGMWAFAIWDNLKKDLIVSRDRFGIKPLYLTRVNHGWAFASEIKPLLALRENTPEPDLKSMADFFAHGMVDGQTQTWFKEVLRFPAASFAILKASQSELECKRYWDFKTREKRKWKDCQEEFESLVDNAVQISLRSDVKVGICLSGGVDSSTLAAIAATQQPIQAFTSRHHEALGDEYPYVQKIVDKFPNVESHYVFPENNDIETQMGDLLWHLEEPAKATGVFSQWKVVNLAAGKVKVLLDGQGGDEVFGGYGFHRFPHLVGLLSEGNFKAFYRESGRFDWKTYAKARVTEQVAHLRSQVIQNIFQDRAMERYRGYWTSSFYQDWYQPALSRETPSISSLQKRLKWDIESEMLPALLRYEDKISMAFSIESRVPLLDYRLVEFAFQLDEADMIYDGWTKYPLRKTIERYGLNEVAWRKDKKAFHTPLNMYLRNFRKPISEWLSQGELVKNGILDSARIESLMATSDSDNYSRQLWQVLQAELWFRGFITGDFRNKIALDFHS